MDPRNPGRAKWLEKVDTRLLGTKDIKTPDFEFVQAEQKTDGQNTESKKVFSKNLKKKHQVIQNQTKDNIHCVIFLHKKLLMPPPGPVPPPHK